LKQKKYTESFKERAVEKLQSPWSSGIRAVASELGLPKSTLWYWKEKYAKTTYMKKNTTKSGKNWSSEQKLDVLIKTSSMSENELGIYLRSNGLHSSDIMAFKNDLTSSSGKVGRQKLDPEVVGLRKTVKTLEKDLRKNQAVQAEQNARIKLLKKSHEIWGQPEDEE
jgi:transposase-like protein